MCLQLAFSVSPYSSLCSSLTPPLTNCSSPTNLEASFSAFCLVQNHPFSPSTPSPKNSLPLPRTQAAIRFPSPLPPHLQPTRLFLLSPSSPPFHWHLSLLDQNWPDVETESRHVRGARAGVGGRAAPGFLAGGGDRMRAGGTVPPRTSARWRGGALRAPPRRRLARPRPDAQRGRRARPLLFARESCNFLESEASLGTCKSYTRVLPRG